MPRKQTTKDANELFTVITDYVVQNLANSNRFSFSRLPNLLVDLPDGFAEPGEEVIIEQRIIAQQRVTITRAIRTKEGYLVTDAELNRYHINFDEVDNEDNIGE